VPWASRAASLFRRLLHRKDAEEELDAEIQAHLELLTERYLAKGLSYQDARRSARLEFGNPEQVKQTVRESRAGAAIEASLQDALFAWRILRKYPGFTTAATLTLALGIGMTTAIFSLVSNILLRPLPYPDPARIVLFITSSPTGLISAASPIKFNAWRQQATVFDDISGYRFGRMNMTGTDRPEQVQAALVSAGYFRLFGLSVMRGRPFSADEDRPGYSGVAVVSEAFCKRVFGGDAGIIGRTIFLEGRLHEIIGIAAAGTGVESPATYDPSSAKETIDVWMPLQVDPDATDQNGFFNVAARLKPGVTVETAAAQLKLATEEFRRKFPSVDGMPPKSVFTIQSMKDVLVNGARPPLFVLSGAVGMLLLIACANVANLLLARAEGRKREIAVRTAVGASRGRIIRQLLTESVVLSTFGGVLGFILGRFGIKFFLSLNTIAFPGIGDNGSAITLDWRVWLFTGLISLVTGTLFGLIPALQASRTDLRDALKGSNGQAGTGFRNNKARSLLVVSQVALALVLLVGAGLLIRSFVALRSVSPGFDPHDILTMRISLTAPQFQKTSVVSELVREGVQRISALPNVVSAAATCCLPLEDRTIGDVIIAGRA
jgi:putative ABC transport system permease protein